MRNVEDWDESDLRALIRDEVQEGLTLEFKRSPALGKDNNKKNELSKDVSAFANSQGGMIIYGMIEDGHVATAIDAGTDRTVITKEWLESIINANISPAVDGILIKQIGLRDGAPDAVAYVIKIPAATSRAPHQAFDHKYYKRHNFESTPMEDYEIRDLMRRGIEFGRKFGVAWDLRLEIQRLMSAINERGQIDNQNYLPRTTLAISVSPRLRESGVALALLPKVVRSKVADLIGSLDDYNADIETRDPGQRDLARLSDPLKTRLASALATCGEVSAALSTILESEP